MSETEHLQVRFDPANHRPALIYLPGLHGDWTLIGAFRHHLAGRLNLVELTYPRTLTWSLDDYAQAIENGLRKRGIQRGWLLGESFGSQLAWPLVSRGRLEVDGVILAGGFAQHPLRLGVRFAESVANGLPLRMITAILFGYAKIARFRYRREPAIMANLDEFIARRTELDRQAAVHRLRLIAANMPDELVRQVRVPVYAVAGLLDPVVPWPPVRRFLRSHCPALREYRIIRADHNVLSTGAPQAAELAVRWVTGAL